MPDARGLSSVPLAQYRPEVLSNPRYERTRPWMTEKMRKVRGKDAVIFDLGAGG
ncbi:hypothetical protein ACVWZK_006607 [Bradyrhizobium sp. GM0.4]